MTAAAPPRFHATGVRRAPLLLWLLALAAGIAAMIWLGQGHLATPSATDPSAWGLWLRRTDPLVAAMAVFRLFVLALAWYLIGVTGVSVVAHLSRAARLVRLADALALPVVRRVAQQAVGVALATAAVAGATAVPTPRQPPTPVAASSDLAAPLGGETIAMARLDPEVLAPRRAGTARSGAETVAAISSGGGGSDVTGAYRLRMERLAEPSRPRAEPEVGAESLAEDAVPAPRGHPPAAPATGGAAEATPDQDEVAGGEHTVVPGDHLWSIAEGVLTTAWGRAPTDDETAPYWHALVEANRSRLVTPDDPDLLLPGQRLVVPPAPTAP